MERGNSRGGRGRGGGRGRSRGGRGRGRGNSNQDQGHRIGDRIVLSSVEAGFAPPPPPSRNSQRSRPVQTGTEEILGNIIEPENDISIFDSKINKRRKEIKEKEKATAAAVIESESDGDVDMSELQGSSDALLTQIKFRPMVTSNDNKFEFNGYKDIWEKGQHNKATRMKGDYQKVKERVCVVRPIPRAQPAHYLNKFARHKLPLAEPHFRKLKPHPPMTFTSQAVYQQFRGTEALSKVAGNILSSMIKDPQSFKQLFSIQIPNSIRTLSTNAESFEDIKIASQNIMKNDAQNETAAIKGPAHQQSLKMKKPRYHCLTQYSSEKPFGKLQLLKSGRVVLRVGNRVFDVCMSTPNHDTHVGVIFEQESSSLEGNQSPRTSTTLLQDHQDNLFLLGKIDHFFTAYYDYQKILKELDGTATNSG